MIPKCTPILEIALMQELQMFKALVEKATKHQIGPQNTIRKVFKHRCLKCPFIIQLDMICMN
jgi:hypothetical protein